MAMQSIMVVGGSGFIGQHAARAFAAHGHKVYATHGPGRAAPRLSGVTWIACNLGTAQAAHSWPSSCDTVIYLAQAREHRDFPRCSPDIFAVNVIGLHQALEYALRCDARRFLYASTGSIYSSQAPVAVETVPLEITTNRSFYIASKLASEVLLGPYAKLLPMIVLRLFMPYGLGQKADMLLPQLIEKVRAGKPIYLHGPEGLRANPVAVADVADALVRCTSVEESVTMNLAGPEVLTLRAIAETIGRVLGRPPLFDVGADKPPNFVGATTRLRQSLNWEPGIRLEEGLRLWLEHAAYPLAG